MTRSQLLVGAIVLLLTAFPVAWRAGHLRDARAALDSAERTRSAVRALIVEQEALRAREARIGVSSRPAEDVQTPIVELIESLALDTRLFRTISETENTALDRPGEPGAASGYRRQSMSVQFNPMPLSSMGAFLAAWREREPEWTPSRIVLTVPTRRGVTEAPSYGVQMTLTSIYLDEEGGSG